MKDLRKVWLGIIIVLNCLVLIACASIPPEAPEMSAELGKRIVTIQNANITLLHRFFDLKRAEVDQFIQNEWVPTFAQEIFSDPAVKKAWDTIVAENNTSDRLRFLITMGPKLQERINRERIELVKPLDDVERRIEETLRNEYTQAEAINNSLTSFLVSASRVEQNRNRYLQMMGINDNKIGTAIDSVNDVVGNLLSGAEKVDNNVKKANEYLQKLREIKNSLGFNKKEE
jgi:hypothetical protein